jgi:N-acetylglucosamine kinase-like BadF-type ATPase
MDGGGTKTAFFLADGDGNTLAESRQQSCYYFDKGIGLVSKVIRAGIDAVTAEAGITPADIDYAYFGIPGYGEASADLSTLDAAPKAILGHDRYICGNDMIGGWAGSLAGADGINVIAGTGSMAYGERVGQTHRVGGWSEVFGDEGSAYWIAIQGLNAFSKMADGRMDRGPLYDLMRDRVAVSSDLDLIGVVVDQWGAERGAIADLAKVIVEADDAGDAVAAAILHRAHVELAQLVTATAAALNYEPGETVSVSYSGGMFVAESFRSGFAQALREQSEQFHLLAPQHGPSLGSVLYAMKHAGADVPPRFALAPNHTTSKVMP